MMGRTNLKKKQGAFVIAGGSRGLSRIIAAHAHKAGYPVALIARTRKDLLLTKMEIEANCHTKKSISIHVADLTKEGDANQVFAKIRHLHGEISVLINNAATWTGGKSIQNLTVRDIQKSLDLNFFTAFNSTKALLSGRNTSRSEITVINIGATASLQGWEQVFAFCAGKGILRTFSQSLARELQATRVHVAHVIIDGLIGNTRTYRLNPKIKKSRFMSMNSIATAILQIVDQEKSCWTFELDLRPYNEKW
jgi:short-subunit dehydrogenase